MDFDKSMWLCLPDSLVLQIFTNLSSSELLRAAQTCRAWLRISKDELLWKALLYKEWKIDHSVSLRQGQTSFFCEFQRLKCHVPCVEVQVLREHTDQVLHVSFSHNGKMFATCSKDGTIKVWKTGPPISLKHSRAMKDLFRWQYTQFSQFNISDTLLLVSGVHFGPNSTSGEIAVFNLKDGFILQARVLNKPYDIFGCWLNNSYLLSGNLHYLGHLSSCSALWLNKATQEVLSEQESVIMRLFKFLNVNASSVRSIAVANCRNLGRGEDYAKAHALSATRGCTQETAPRVGGLPDSSESELDGKTESGCCYMYESDNEMTASESEIGQSSKSNSGLSSSGMRVKLDDSRLNIVTTTPSSLMHQSKSDPCLLEDKTWNTSAEANSRQSLLSSNQLQSGELSSDDSGTNWLTIQSQLQEVVTSASALKRTPPTKRDVSDVSGSPPDVLRKSLRRTEQGSVSSDGQPGTSSAEQPTEVNPPDSADTCYKRLWLRVRQAELRHGRENYDEDLFRMLIEGIDPNYRLATNEDLADVGGDTATPLTKQGKEGLLTPNNTSECSSSLKPLEQRESHSHTVSSHCSSSDAIISSPDCEPAASAPFPRTFASAVETSGSATDIVRAWGKKFNFGSNESLDDEPLIRYTADARRGFSDPELCSLLQPRRKQGDDAMNVPLEDRSNTSSSSQSDAPYELAPRTKVRRRKASPPTHEHQHLIFTRGSQAYTPHQIGIKRIDATMVDTLRGPLGVSKAMTTMDEIGAPREERGDRGEPDQAGAGVDFDKVDHVIELNGHAIGMALSPDHRYLYVNCRCWPCDYMISDPLAPPPIAQEIEIRVYDLINLTEVKRLHGHKAFSPNDEFNFIFLDVSDLYVASGAEDRLGYIWDRYYSILLAKLPHHDVVNSVAFNPRDPEMMITASDDHTLKVWYSRHKVMIAENQGL